MSTRRSSSRRSRGAAAVEFALVLPLLLVLVLGTIDWGYFFFVQQVVTNSAREGARAGSIAESLPYSAAKTQAESYLTGTGVGTTATCDADAGADAADPDAVLVTVTCQVGSLTGFLSDFLPSEAHAIAVMRREPDKGTP